MLVDRTVFQPLDMRHSAQGFGRFKLEEMVSREMEGGEPELGSGDSQAKEWEWDWNYRYWRPLGAPWGGTHASAPDAVKFLDEFVGACGKVVTLRAGPPETFREGEPPCEPSANAGSDGASPSQPRRRG